MEKQEVLNALKELRSEPKKRKFSQGLDLIINLKNIDLKKPENHIELYVSLQHGKGMQNKICALVGPEMKDDAEKICDGCVVEKDFAEFAKNKIKVKI